MNKTLDRRSNYNSPTEADMICPYFKERFFEWGEVDKVACCEMSTQVRPCDYRNELEDGTRICLRYDYFPKYEIVEDGGAVTGLDPIPYLEDNKTVYQKQNEHGAFLYWDTTVTPPIETTSPSGIDQDSNVVTFDHVIIEEYAKKQWFTKQYQDTHQKVWGINDHTLGWHHNV